MSRPCGCFGDGRLRGGSNNQDYLESVREHHAGLHSFRSLRHAPANPNMSPGGIIPLWGAIIPELGGAMKRILARFLTPWVDSEHSLINAYPVG
jgi:hypothetical protein